MAKQIVTDHTGDTVHTFDPKNAVEVKEAMDRFAELTGPKHRMFAAEKGPNGTHKLVRSFDGNAKEVVFNRPLQGG